MNSKQKLMRQIAKKNDTPVIRWRTAGVLLMIILVALLGMPGCGCGGDSSENAAVETILFDSDGRPKWRTLPDGQKVAFEYNPEGYLTAIDAPDLEVSLSYDSRGNLSTITDGTGRTEYRYDSLNRLESMMYEHSPQKWVRCDYDPWNRLTSLTVLDENGETLHSTDYDWNMFGELLAVNTDHGRIEYTHDAETGRFTRSLPNGIVSTFTSSSQGELLSLEHVKSDGELLARFTYTYENGRLDQVSEETQRGNQTIGYGWDERNLLSELTMPDGQTIEYEYDSMGRQVKAGSLDYTYDEYGSIIQAGDQVFEHDANGFVRNITGTGWEMEFDYNVAGELTRLESAERGLDCEWEYDGLGQLTSSNINGAVTSYLPHPIIGNGCTVGEYTASSNRFYTYGDKLLACNDSTAGTSYYLEDGFDSIRLAVDSTGSPIGWRDYSPFGEVTSSQGEIPGGFRTSGIRYFQGMDIALVNNWPCETRTGSSLTDYLAAEVLRISDSPIYTHALTLGSTYLGVGINEAFGTLAGETVGGLWSIADPLSKQIGRISATGGELWTLDDTENWARSALEYLGGKVGERYLCPGPIGSIAGTYMARLLGDAAAATGTFIGTRMDREESWLDLMKWIPQEEYLKAKHPNLFPQIATDRPVLSNVSEVEQELPLFPNLSAAATIDRFEPGPFSPDDSGHGSAASLLPVSPIPVAEKELGGISFDTAMRLTGDFDVGSIAGAVWDTESQCLVLLGDRNTTLPSLDVSDLAVALKCIYGYHGEPAFSLDPSDPKDPSGPNLDAVYYGPIEGTHFGQVMFEADWLMKNYSFGVMMDDNGNKKDFESNVPGYKDIFDLSFENDDGEGESYMRFWITCEDATAYQQDGAIYFNDIEMKVNTEKMFLKDKGLASSNGKQDENAEEWATHFSEHYDGFAEEQPAFAEVKELAKAIAVAKWLYGQGVDVDMDWIDECIADATMDTPTTVAALSHDESREYRETDERGTTIITQTIYLHGGVDMAVPLRSLGDKKGMGELVAAVKSSETPVINIAHDGTDLQALALPLTNGGKSKWGNGEYVENAGIRYYSTGGQVDRVSDGSGNIASFSYGVGGSLNEIHWLLKDYTAVASSLNARDILDITGPDGNRITYVYGTNGVLSEIQANGDEFARFNPQGDTLEVVYGKYTERFVVDSGGHIILYEAGRTDTSDVVRSLEYTYDGEGNLTDISGTDISSIEVSYSEGKPIAVRMPGEEISYSYDPEGRLKNYRSSCGRDTSYAYDGDILAKVTLNSSDRSVMIAFEEGQLVEVTDLNGTGMQLEYLPNGTVRRVTDALGFVTTSKYNEKDHLYEVTFPDRSWVEYKYRLIDQDSLIEMYMHPSDLATDSMA